MSSSSPAAPEADAVRSGMVETSARDLARVHALSQQRPRRVASLAALPRMTEWLARARVRLAEAGAPAAKAAEWMLDNAYLVERAVRQIREDLPRGYYTRLPALALDDRVPRVYAIARALVRASNLQLAQAQVTRFVNAYQEVTPLDLAELWAVPTMLRLTCIELLVAAVERLVPVLSAPLAVPDDESPILIEDTECVARAIRDLATISSIAWGELVRETSVIERMLCDEPRGIYRRMDFETRDRYRRAVEELARGSHHTELDVAQRAVAHARRSERDGGRRAHVGYWLIDEGRDLFEQSLGYRPHSRDRWQRWLLPRAAPLYLTALAGLTAGFVAVPALYLIGVGASVPVCIAGALLALLPSSMLSVTVLHWALTSVLPLRVLPKLAFARGIPAEWKTAVVVPTLLGSADEVRHLLAQIERHFLSNPDPSLRFVLLTDFTDADSKEQPEDDELIRLATEGIERLNREHGGEGRGSFHLLHRERLYNPGEGCWMAWERKRGKLQEFNRLLAGADDTSFVVRVGDPDGLRNVRFVLTLDTDTVLPQGVATRLIGALAHPLNRAEFDPESGRVLAGYTVIQPRVETAPGSGNRSLFTRLYCGDTSIDIYSRAVSDVYQDLFGAGIFVGKGIYDIEAFERSLADRVPENALASHDLFEGIHGRVALATDVALYEDYPAQYLGFTRRMHRWVRGDWQLLPWLRGRVPSASGGTLPSRFDAIDRWKILDNLRRSLLPVALLAFLVAGWLWLPGPPLVWTLLGVLAPAGHLLIDVGGRLAREGRGFFRSPQRGLREAAGRWLLLLVFLPHESAIALDAIVRTLVRLRFTRRHLLEWTTAAHTAALIMRRHPRLLAWREMIAAPLLALVLGAALVWIRPTALVVALPFLALWLAAPEVAERISRTRPLRDEPLSADQIRFLRQLARRTWLFFETFVRPEDHWLPPDNYQEDPGGETAHRTSPTNIGMMFLADLAAFDLGYVSSTDLALRLRNSLETVGRLQHYRGHLLNWYDTQTLEPLTPHYVSAADSGNLLAALLTLKRGCADVATGPALREVRWAGLLDTVDLLQQSFEALASSQTPEGGGPVEPALERLVEQADAIRAAARSARDATETWLSATSGLIERECAALDATLLDTVGARRGSLDLAALQEVRLWLARLHDQLQSMRREAETLLPWLRVLDDAPRDLDTAELVELRERVQELLPVWVPLDAIPERAALLREVFPELHEALGDRSPHSSWLYELEEALRSGGRAAIELCEELHALGARAEREALRMDFRLLYDQESRLLHIGYNMTADRLDPHHYDLLASEARIASFAAIAKGDVPVEHWFALGRPMTRAGGATALLSWGGTMFEYLMPSLLMRSHDGSLLEQSESGALDAQIAYAGRHGVPWGVSESGYAALDADHSYQYRAFGVRGLALKRGLEEELVVTPYAAALALPLRAVAAVENMQRLEQLGALGRYGFFEAVDYTESRLPEGQSFSIVRSFMAHHQGMILAALDNALCGDPLVRRFQSDPRMRASELLLHERVPERLPVETPHGAEEPAQPVRSVVSPSLYAWRPTQQGVHPEIHLLGNGRLATHVSTAGSGALSWRDYAITRWAPDPTLDDAGLWIYVRDEESGALWSVGRQPTATPATETEVVFHPHAVELRRRDRGIALRTEIAVGPADDIEVRRVTVVNETARPRTLTLTSCGELALAPPAEDARHPAFSKLFVESQHLPELDALLFTRRTREPDEAPPVVMHRLVADAPGVTCSGFETDRERFLGRGGSARAPRCLGEALRGTTGATLDTVMALQARVELAPYATAQLAFVTVAGPSQQSVLETAARYDTLASVDWLLADAQSDVAREVQRLDLTPDRLPLLQKLVSLLVCGGPALRAPARTLATNALGQPRLWGAGISGDQPVLLLRMADAENGLLQDLVRAHQLWQRRGVGIDLVVLSQTASAYEDNPSERLHRVLHDLGADALLGRHAGIHLLRADQIPEEERHLLEASARVILDDARPLEAQLTDLHPLPHHLPHFQPTSPVPRVDRAPPLERPRDLLFDNGLGGFTPDGREYVIHLEAGVHTPAPWCNVLANREFGSLVTEAGGGYSWAENCAEFRLTPWSNDPVTDRAGESLYLRDEETAQVWTPTPSPAARGATCQVRHGAGYTEWRQNSHGLEQRLRVFVPLDDPVKIIQLRLRNAEARSRRLTATYYAEWVLGRTAAASRAFTLVEYDPTAAALLARNRWTPEFAERVAFLTSESDPHGFTADRAEFLGREGDASAPAALGRWGLNGALRPGLDPCAALQIHIDLGPGEEVETFFVLGAGRDAGHARALARAWRERDTVDAAWQKLGEHWDAVLGAVEVRTPDPAMDLMLNRWLLYQTLSSRVLGRTGFYQSSGAYGFRDQLQDVLALLHVDPGLARAHVLDCSSRQFEEGDVLHWWHPPSGRGVRTRCSDDLLWLPFVAARYVEVTGDLSILDEEVPFLRAPPLRPEERDRYGTFELGARASLFEHLQRALVRGVTRGPRGLPLIGDGDWNDGMNRVGSGGRGESVWLAWFAVAVQRDFARLCARREDAEQAEVWERRALELAEQTDREAWDGAWYVRAYDDEGRAWGSESADECRIDSVSQSWAVLSGGAPAERARQALVSAETELVRQDLGLARLLWPPFDATPRDPGYIKAYPPGVRENGGQYSHAAAWLGWAFARAGDGERAARIFGFVNPILHSSTKEAALRYRVEPYVAAADVVGDGAHAGRGGWTWYTGAAAWTWRLGIEAILGLEHRDGRLRIDPHLPPDWSGYEATLRTGGGTLEIVVENPHRTGHGVAELRVDEVPVEGNEVELPGPGVSRRVTVQLGDEAGGPA